MAFSSTVAERNTVQASRALALLEVLGVWVLLKIAVKAYFTTELVSHEIALLTWPYSVQFLQLGAALVMILAFGRSRRTYGLVPNWQHDLRLGGALALLFIVLHVGGTAAFGGLALKRTSASAVISTVIFQFFLSGIGEEVVFRGYMQSRLNQAFGRPWSVGGIRFGMGLVLTALLFGLGHALDGFNPFVHSYNWNLFAGVVTGIWAVLYGLMREKTGSVLGAGILHGHEAVGENLVMTLPGQLAYVVGLAVAFWVVLSGGKAEPLPRPSQADVPHGTQA